MSFPRLPDTPLDFGFEEEHALLRDEARRFLAERCPIDAVRRLAEDPLGHDPALWKDLASLGWVGLTLPERVGGAGLSPLHLALVLEEMGRVLLPSPYFGCLLAGFALEEAGGADADRLAGAIASGELIGSVALGELPSGGAGEATAEKSDGGYVLRGRKAFVPAGTQAGVVIAPFSVGGELALFAVELPSAGVTAEAETGIDPTRRTARLTFDGARVAASARLPGDGPLQLRRLALRGALALAAEMVGGIEATLLLTRDYAIERKQFGRQIGSFQAVKHPIVNTLISGEIARTHVVNAAAVLGALGDPEAAELPIRMAKAAASEAFPAAARRGVQLHGGYGFTWDCDVHFYFKRAIWSRAYLGDATQHRRELATALFPPRE